MSELRKIVSDGLHKFRAYEEADKALKELDSLDQAKKDYTKDVETLKKEKEKLSKEVSTLAAKISDADQEAAFKIKTAEEKSKSIMDSVQKTIDEAQLVSQNKLRNLESDIAHHESLADEANKKAIEAQAKLDRINKELEGAKTRLKEMID